ncbi:MAG: NAD(P)-dependent glycerol-3-phosphate dehydrogenase [Oscillospiraceae bacterium]|nr:NAD(P)-dependent glycerol-3-phosphate dehydrogenase [Oscillospiraceae bacterium]MDY6207863.1 NAD(P)H-dependent glycerol-3-phosphate dehydrogenase [Oscillospiraceae bacterium]
MDKANIMVLGSGGFGLSLAVMLNGMGHDVTVWSKFRTELDDIRRDGENKAKLPGVKISEKIRLTDDISEAKGKDLIIFGIPVNFVRSVAKEVAPYIDEKTVLVNTGKGLEGGSLKFISQVIFEETGKKIVVLTGPSHAEEVAIGMPTTVIAASEIPSQAEYVQSVMSNSTLRIYNNDDVIGCEIGGALKNVIALCAGICDGMGFGDNTKAALMTRGIWEISRLGMALGGKQETFAGLSGVGDLIVTCTSMHSRNRRAGILIGQGVSPDEAVKQVGTVEGYFCTKAAYELSRKCGICLPITEKCYNVLYNGASPRDAIRELMGRPKRHESEISLYDLK